MPNGPPFRFDARRPYLVSLIVAVWSVESDAVGMTERAVRGRTRLLSISNEMMNEQLGAMTHVEGNGGYTIRGVGCPLAALTGKHPGVCLAMESLVAEVVGARVRECCDRSEKPQCCFEIRSRSQSQPNAK